jgi:glycerophosphoryl diester phosphodiesterase
MSRPIVIAHRGFPGRRLEHTRASYELAIEAGADFIEPDLVVSADGQLVIRHENNLTETTDVADRPQFAGRRRTATVDGETATGWFTEDFTLDELKSLRVTERIPQIRPNNRSLTGEILTFDEALDIALAAGVGIYPETKHPLYFQRRGFELNDLLIETLERRGLNRADGPIPITVQSFETTNLRELRDRTPHTLIQLLEHDVQPYDLAEAGDQRTGADFVTLEGLAELASYADGIGVDKELVYPRDANGAIGRRSSVVDDAHAAGLLVHVWTMRDENTFLPRNLRRGDDPAAPGDAKAEYRLFFAAGVDGVFSDYTSTAVAALADS